MQARARLFEWPRQAGQDDPNNTIVSQIDRGFTGHEQLHEVALIHMNGRVYDPVLGRFLSADPFIQNPLNLQALNRYSYVLNNPLAYTDPSGFFLRGLRNFFAKNPIIGVAIGVAVSVFVGPQFALALGFEASTAGALAAAGALGGATSGLLSGGLQGAVFGAISGGLTGGIGGADLGLGALNWAGKAALIGMGSGILSEAQGGQFGPAFLAAAFGTAAGAAIGTQFPGTSFEAIAARTVAGAVIGGTASVIGGGKFQNGAASGAFAAAISGWAEAVRRERMFVEPDVGYDEYEAMSRNVGGCRGAGESQGCSPSLQPGGLGGNPTGGLTPRDGPVDFVVGPRGSVIPVPEHAKGPLSTRSPGMMFDQAPGGGNGFHPNVTGVRIMDAGGQHRQRVIYSNSRGQPVDPQTGRTLSDDHPNRHIPWE